MRIQIHKADMSFTLNSQLFAVNTTGLFEAYITAHSKKQTNKTCQFTYILCYHQPEDNLVVICLEQILFQTAYSLVVYQQMA